MVIGNTAEQIVVASQVEGAAFLVVMEDYNTLECKPRTHHILAYDPDIFASVTVDDSGPSVDMNDIRFTLNTPLISGTYKITYLISCDDKCCSDIEGLICVPVEGTAVEPTVDNIDLKAYTEGYCR